MSSAGIRDRISDYNLFTRFHFYSNLMMGCSSSQAVPPGGNAIAAAATDPENLVDNSNSEAKAASEVSSADKYPPAEAFEISLDDVDNDNDDGRSDSLIKKHPPKRLQKLVEQAATAVPATTIEHLEEKLAKAEVRRQQYIQQRIENIITITSKGGNGAAENADNGNDNDDDLKDGQKDGEAAVIVSRNTTSTTTTTSSSNSTSSNNSHDADVVVQSTTLLNEPSATLDKKHGDEEHHGHGSSGGDDDDGNGIGTHPK